MHEEAAAITPDNTTMNDRLQKHRETLLHFSAAWARGDVDGLLELMTADPVYRGSSGPGPGSYFQGRDAVRTAFARMVPPQTAAAAATLPPPPQMYFFEDRALVYWNLSLPGPDGTARAVDGVDIITFDADGKIAVKDAYRKAFS